ncbi:MAG: alpha-glucosidase [Clostridia bacterium]
MNKQWQKDLIVYQIYPRSFRDGNGDGKGDIEGVIEKVDYLQSLGVNAVWFSPLYCSPNVDYGYDISDYKRINPEYGTLEQFDEMVKLLHARKIRVIMDLVINHTSNEHMWFKESQKSVDNPYRDYYYWRKGKGNKPPNNWTGFFSEKAWEYDKNTDMWYMHLFAKNQPDLNYGNPKVIEEIKSVLKFWLDRSVDGFRCDVITLLSKTVGLPNGKNSIALVGKEHYVDGNSIHELLLQLKQVMDEYDCFTVGEGVLIDTTKALTYIENNEKQQLNAVFTFEHMNADNHFGIKYLMSKMRYRKLKRTLGRWQTELYGKAINTIYFENHDQPRAVGRFCSDSTYADKGAKMIAVMEMGLTGIPFIYEGQEIAMTSIKMQDLSQYKDVECLNMYKMMRKLRFSQKYVMRAIAYASRDNARTPMQWNDSENAGFGGKPWISINPNYKEINVENQEKDANSVLNFYRKLIAIRKSNGAMKYGEYKEYFPLSSKVYVYTKTYEKEKVLIVINFTSKSVSFKLPKEIRYQSRKVLINNYVGRENYESSYKLRPYEATIYSIVNND